MDVTCLRTSTRPHIHTSIQREAPMRLEDLPTPSLLVEKERLARNIRRMQEKAEANGVRLRPHAKTHKAPWVARRQAAEGAEGITVATPGEAEVFAEAGFEDVRLAYTIVGRHKHERLAQLMADGVRVSFCVDTAESARQASDIYAGQGRPAEVFIEIDVGHGRCGVPWEDERAAAELAREITVLPGLRLAGLLTHAGQAYRGPEAGEVPEAALRRVAAAERDRMLHVAAGLREAGVEGVAPGRFEISIGSTPTMSQFVNTEREGFSVTEIRPGNYIFHDAIQVALGAARLDDCALTVLSTVISKRRGASGTERLYLDAGKKVLTSDTGYDADGHGILLYNAKAMRPMPHARIVNLSEEHGWVEVPGGAAFGVGDRLRLVPNHACTAVATQEQLYLADGEDVLEKIPVAARNRI